MGEQYETASIVGAPVDIRVVFTESTELASIRAARELEEIRAEDSRFVAACRPRLAKLFKEPP